MMMSCCLSWTFAVTTAANTAWHEHPQQEGQELYVSPGAAPGGDGTVAKPFQTLSAAQAGVRALIAGKKLTSDVTVHLGPGTYYQRDALRFTGADAGRDGHRIRWVGPGPSAGTDPSKAAIIHGGIAITSGWARTSPGSPIWATNVTQMAPPPPPPGLLVDGRLARPPPPPPPPLANSTYAHCGSVEVGVSYNGHDIESVMAGGVDQCCRACAAHPGCKAWSYCWLPHDGEQCGSASKPVDCYLKTAANGSGTAFFEQRISGTPGNGCKPDYHPHIPGKPPRPAPTPHPPPPGPPPYTGWRFFNLLEAREGATLARLPDRGSGYLKDLGCHNGDTSLTCPLGVLPPGLSADDVSVFVNVGSDWFTSTRTATSATATTVGFESKASSYSANDKIYLQGDKTLISEAGEWALEHRTGMLYYWPRDQAAMEAGSAEIVVTTTVRVFDFHGSSWDAGGRAESIDVSGVVISGSDFMADYLLFKRTNDTPLRFREGAIRFENASDISFTDSAVLDAGFSGFWLQGFSQNITISGNRIERPGFCGVFLQGIYPGDTTSDSIGAIAGGPIDSAEKSDVNKGHLITDNSIHDYGRRVGHGSGLWFFQAGRTRVTHNQVIEGPRDAFGVYGVRQGSFPKAKGSHAYGPLYGKTIDLWGGLANLHSRYIEIDHNRVANVIRDTSDAGALEYWGVGAWNTAHHNCFSDMDPGLLGGGWLNFLFQDDAAHYLNHSSNILFEVKSAGSEEAGMIKSIESVFSNNIVADSVVGHAFQLTPYLEPAANMVFTQNIFANLSTTGSNNSAPPPPPPAGQPPPPPSPAETIDTVINGFTTGTLATSGHLSPFAGYGFENGPPEGFPPLKLTDKVMRELDRNTYFGVQHHNLSGVKDSMLTNGWDLHATNEDPMFLRSAESIRHPWNRSCSDYTLAPGSPALKLGFRQIDGSKIGLTSAFKWDMAALNLRNASAGRKIQAESYNRMRGLWRIGSSWIGGAEGSSKSTHFQFSSDAWARFDKVHTECGAGCTVQVRFKSASKPDSYSPRGTHRRISISVGAPLAAQIIATTAAPVFSTDWTMLNLTTPNFTGLLTGETVFLLLDGECFVDYFRFVPK
jgi:hypothetical protein